LEEPQLFKGGTPSIDGWVSVSNGSLNTPKTPRKITAGRSEDQIYLHAY